MSKCCEFNAQFKDKTLFEGEFSENREKIIREVLEKSLRAQIDSVCKTLADKSGTHRLDCLISIKMECMNE